jgi:hypothetical protein
MTPSDEPTVPRIRCQCKCQINWYNYVEEEPSNEPMVQFLEVPDKWSDKGENVSSTE